MGRRVLAILVAAVLALLGALLVFTYAKNADNRAVAGQQPKAVYVTKSVLPAGTTLKDALAQGLVTKTTVAAKAEPVGALESIDTTNQNLLAVADVAPGQYLLSAGFGTTKIGTKAITIPDGMLAISVSLSDPARVGNFVTPGSHITVFETAKLKKFGTDPASKQFNELDIRGTAVLLPDALVIGMGNATTSPAVQPAADTANAQAQSGGASFLVTPGRQPDGFGAARPRHSTATRCTPACAAARLRFLRGSKQTTPTRSGSDDEHPLGPRPLRCRALPDGARGRWPAAHVGSAGRSGSAGQQGHLPDRHRS